MPDGNVEVKAIFEKDAPPAPTEFIVTFDGNGGTPSVGSMTTTNQKLTSLPSASRSGSYSFDGWYTEKSGGTKITTDTVFSANTTVYAHWTYIGGGGGYNPPVTYYTLRFETGGGSDIPSVREAYNAYIDLSQVCPHLARPHLYRLVQRTQPDEQGFRCLSDEGYDRVCRLARGRKSGHRRESLYRCF